MAGQGTQTTDAPIRDELTCLVASAILPIAQYPNVVPPVVQEYAAILAAAGYGRPILAIERHAFYARAAEAYAVVATGEPRFWGNLILKKGAIPPPEGA